MARYIWVNIGSGNSLMPSGYKPLPELMLTQVYVAISYGIIMPQWVNVVYKMDAISQTPF